MLLVLQKANAYSTNAQKDSVVFYLEKSKSYVYDNFTKAEFYLKKADRVAKKSKIKNLEADVAHNYGASYYIVGNYDFALQKFMEALFLYESQNNKRGISKCIAGQGLIQLGIGRYNEANKLFQRAILINRELGDENLLSKNLLNVGISQSELKHYEDAYKSFHQSLKLSKKNKFKDNEHLALNRLGNILYLKNEIDSSIYYYQKVISDTDEANLWEKSFAFSGLSEAYSKKGNYKLAEEFGLTGFRFAKMVQANWDIARAAEILSVAYKKDNNFEEAYKYLEISKSYTDSLFNEAKLKEINLLQLDRKESENQKLIAKNEVSQQKLKNAKIFTISVILLMLFVLTILYQYVKNSKLKEKLFKELEEKNLDIENQKALIINQNENLSELNQTKNKLFSILSHDLKSPINSIQQVLELLKAGEISNDELKIMTEHLVVQVDKTSAMLNNMLHWSMTQLDGAKTIAVNINLENVINDSVGAMFLMMSNKKIQLRVEDKKAMIVKADENHAHIIINNLLSNAIKYTPEDGLIDIKYTESITCYSVHITNSGSKISDNKIEEILNFDKRMISEMGTGLEEGTGLGLLLVKQFLSDNNGKLDILYHPEKGTEFVASFPKAK